TEDAYGVECRRCRESDFHSVEVFEYPAVFGDVVFLVSEAELGVGEFAIKEVAAVALIDHHQVVLIDGWRLREVLGEEDAFYQALNRADMALRLRVWFDCVESLEAEDVSEGLGGYDSSCCELSGCLCSKGVSVHDKTHPAEAFRG